MKKKTSKKTSRRRSSKPKADAYQIMTDRIVGLLEQGVVPWRRPWKQLGGLMPQNLKSKKAYRGVNVFWLACAGYGSPYWVTFKQAKALGGSVRKGEKGFPVIFWKWLEREDEDTGKSRRIPMLRYYTVFNVEQCEGIEDKVPQIDTDEPVEFEPIERCEQIVESFSGPSVRTGDSRAYYVPSTDLVNMPKRELFETAESYYSVLFHELGHSTGHESRLGREGITDATMFGSHKYSKEELVAEMTAAFLSGHCAIDSATVENSAAYIQGWLKKLRNDTKLLVSAAAQAQKAADLILGRSFETEKKSDDDQAQGALAA
jgi:antirestriction protein ArdC